MCARAWPWRLVEKTAVKPGQAAFSVKRRKSRATLSWQQLQGVPEKRRSRRVVSVPALSISDLWEPDHSLMQKEAGCCC